MSLFDRVTTSNLKEFRDQKIELACVVTDSARQISKRDGAEWGRLTVEDFLGTASVLAFGDVWGSCKELLQKDTPVLLRGTVSGRERDEEDPPIFLDSVVPLHRVRETGDIGVCIELGPGHTEPDTIERVRTRLAGSPGMAPVVVMWTGNTASGSDRTDSTSSRLRSRTLKVSPGEELIRDLRDVFGEERVRLVRA
jgi:DNA polymerase-3 subunit alpha